MWKNKAGVLKGRLEDDTDKQEVTLEVANKAAAVAAVFCFKNEVSKEVKKQNKKRKNKGNFFHDIFHQLSTEFKLVGQHEALCLHAELYQTKLIIQFSYLISLG